MEKLESIQYGTKHIEFKLIYADRKTLGITVNPDLSVKVRAPKEATRTDIFKKVEKRAAWIVAQKRFFLGFEPRKTPYTYRSGETHYYLGRQYRLKIKNGPAEEVSYYRNLLIVETKDKTPENVRKLLNEWYRRRAKIKFAEYAEPLILKFKKYGVEPNKIYIQNMKLRWGSCSAKGNIILNPELIKASKPCIEYVIIHELCHLIHRNHTRDFFDLQQRKMPDWKKWKNKLEEFMA